MKKQSILALLLAALMLAGTACGGTENTEDTAPAQTEATTPVETEPVITFESVRDSYNDRDYGGYVLRLGARDNIDWETCDMIAEELTGEAINDAVYNRNTALEETMNIKITEFRMGGSPSVMLK